MRINVYSQELTDEVLALSKVSNTGVEYHAAQLILHSSRGTPPALRYEGRDENATNAN